MAEYVLDSSAILADLHGEPGGDITRAAMRGSVVSAVNYAEVVTKLIEKGASPPEAEEIAGQLDCAVIEIDQARAVRAGLLHASTRRTGVSLGDRFCLALGQELGWPVLTGDRRWKTLGLDVEVTLIR
jgi:PIN domain nuclease of toxin-antitoxin system